MSICTGMVIAPHRIMLRTTIQNVGSERTVQ